MFSFVSHPLIAAIILIAILIFVHEFGHFIVGRLCGIGVEVFSIGFGPEIISFKHNKITYKLCWIPLGGYVKFYGAFGLEENIEDDGEVNGIKFLDAKAWKKMLTVSAGPGGNFLFAAVMYMILACSGIPYHEALIGDVRVGSVAHVVGLVPDDKIVKINGQSVTNWEMLRKKIATSANQELKLEVERNGHLIDINIVPEEVETKDIFGKTIKEGKFGISIARPDASFYIDSLDTKKNNLVQLFKIISLIREDGSKVEINFSNEVYRYIDELLEKPHDRFISLKAVVKENDSSEEIIKDFKFDSSKGSTGKELCRSYGIKEALLVVGDKLEKETEEFFKEVDEKNKLRMGDIILKWNGLSIRDIYDLSQVQSDYRQKTADIEILRNFKNMTVTVSLFPMDVQLPSGKETIYTLANSMYGTLKTPQTKYLKYGFFKAMGYGMTETVVQSKELTVSLFKLVTGSIPLQALGGPMMIAKVASDSVKAGLSVFLGTLAIISINLGVLNLFPIPILDGGQFVIYTIEFIRKKRVTQLVLDSYQKIGFIMVMALIILATYNDFSRFWTSMLKTISDWGSKF